MKNGELEQCGYPNAVINLSFGDGLCLYSPFVMILGMLYYWVPHYSTCFRSGTHQTRGIPAGVARLQGSGFCMEDPVGTQAIKACQVPPAADWWDEHPLLKLF